MVMRWMNIVACALVCATAIGLFLYKSETRELAKQAAQLEQKLDKERESVSVLQAEWSHLTNPERLERLAKKFLGMKPAAPDQYLDGSDETATGSIQDQLDQQ